MHWRGLGSLPEVARRLGIPVSGRLPKIRCLFHEDRDPSLILYEDHYHCFGCGSHGGVVDFVMAVRGCSYRDAVQWLDGGVSGIARSDGFRSRMGRRAEMVAKWLERSEVAANVCLTALLDFARYAERAGNPDLAMAAYADAWLWEDPERGVLARLARMDPDDAEQEFREKKRYCAAQADAMRRAVCLPLALRLWAEEEAVHIRSELSMYLSEIQVFMRMGEAQVGPIRKMSKQAGVWRWHRRGSRQRS